ncbi:hypothetical protein FB567DRAFT_608911 [Paraphoma chrysanthemicola]|uniref:F-box domain-containing protein n=1 Tax=Paraphoma chrysanthemicola TaxID=798071 RepID=A0A8K0QX26_9PLEO|nr:hypothetical protein FB567DRAFT_608911 [Paraphoma chrysanthemicola]
MEDDHLTEAQRRAVDWLNEHIERDPRELQKGCKLDYGHHQLNPKEDLGALKVLPTEICCQILEYTDVKSLLVFRRVNQRAMATVDEMPAFKKVMTYARDTVRLAIYIHTAQTFTIGQLYDKLCQQKCDSGCGKHAPYLDVFKMTRQCLRVGGECGVSEGPVNQTRLANSFWKPLDRTDSTFAFAMYTSSAEPAFDQLKDSGLPCFSIVHEGGRVAYYDHDEAHEFLLNKGFTKTIFLRPPFAPGFLHLPPSGWKQATVRAPWISSKGQGFVHSDFCEKCVAVASRSPPATRVRRSLSAVGRSRFIPPVSKIAFGPSEWLANHLREGHSDGQLSHGSLDDSG